MADCGKMRILKINGPELIGEAVSLGTLIDEINKIRSQGQQGDTLFYRGQANREWDAVPGIFRRSGSGNYIYQRDAERDFLMDFLCRFNKELRDKTAFEKLLTAQHYGLPTRLMDVTLNPLVALYFTCATEKDKEDKDAVIFCYKADKESILSPDSDKLRILSNIAFLRDRDKENIRELRDGPLGEVYDWNDVWVEERLKQTKDREKYYSYLRLMHFLKIEAGHFDNLIQPKHLRKCFFVNPVFFNSRITAQSGGFIIVAFHEGYERLNKADNEKAGISLAYKIEIPKSCKKNLQDELDALNIRKETLFPDMDHVSKYLKERYKA